MKLKRPKQKMVYRSPSQIILAFTSQSDMRIWVLHMSEEYFSCQNTQFGANIFWIATSHLVLCLELQHRSEWSFHQSGKTNLCNRRRLFTVFYLSLRYFFIMWPILFYLPFDVKWKYANFCLFVICFFFYNIQIYNWADRRTRIYIIFQLS